MAVADAECRNAERHCLLTMVDEASDVKLAEPSTTAPMLAESAWGATGNSPERTERNRANNLLRGAGILDSRR